MMRSPDLAACLKSPHLWYEETASALVPKDLEAADKFLNEMKGRKDAVEQIVGAYQAVYCATQALLHSINYKSTGFRAVVTVLEQYFLQKGIITRTQIDQLLRAQKLEGTPQENFDAATAYVAHIKQALGKQA